MVQLRNYLINARINTGIMQEQHYLRYLSGDGWHGSIEVLVSHAVASVAEDWVSWLIE